MTSFAKYEKSTARHVNNNVSVCPNGDAADSIHCELSCIGTKISVMRKARGLSQRSLAKATDLSPSYISQVERGIVQPSLISLKKISRAMGVSITEFFQGNDEPNQLIVRRHERKKLGLNTPDVQYELLTPTLEGKTVEFLFVTLAPGVREEPFAHEGEEYGVVIAGKVGVLLGDAFTILYEGDSIHFESKIMHALSNEGTAEAKIVWAISPPHY